VSFHDHCLGAHDIERDPHPPMGGFVMLQLSFFKDRLLVTGGDRLVDFRQMNRPNTSKGPVRFGGDHANIPKYGALYPVTLDIGVSCDQSQVYQPRTTTDASDNPLAPLERNQDEVGLKLSLFNSRVREATPTGSKSASRAPSRSRPATNSRLAPPGNSGPAHWPFENTKIDHSKETSSNR
jgi:outer membrane receptor for ferric coprogen and ferric-rhodotorulic acid